MPNGPIQTRRKASFWAKLALLGVALALSPAQAQAAADADDANKEASRQARIAVNDPFENMNRRFFAFNTGMDHKVIRPTAELYRTGVPKPFRRSIRNFLNNFRTPIILANDLLQGEWKQAENTTTRFLVNSTVGVLGLFDIAAYNGYKFHDEDFGQTLAVWGVGEGPYFVLPLYGSAPPRDMTGIIMDRAFNPLTYLEDTDRTVASVTLTTFDLIDLRAENIENVDSIERTSLDYYATIRSIYRQNRKAEIANGREDPEELEDFDFDLDDFDLE
ncbi:MAG: VacJ family lipoprotein [Alphaproteobacteria bacterium]|nr:MAG: VacJ family lipoprotein [Alphaproteobacteria bacterium]